MNIYQDILLFICILLLMVLLVACDDRTINGYEDEEGIFSVYGALDVDGNRHVIRVRNLLEPFNENSTFPIDATVTFSNLETGATTVLQDSVIQFTAGKVHNYILKKDLNLDTSYQLTVERSDGATVIATATTPGLTVGDHEPDDEFVFCESRLEFTYKNVHPPEFIQMDIEVDYKGDTYRAPMRIVGKLQYHSILEHYYVRMSPRNLLVEIFPPILPDDPYYDPYRLMPTVSCDELDKREIRIRFTHFGLEWKTGQPIEYGPVDIESGLIENGLGFLGAFRQDTLLVYYYPNPE